MMRGVVPIQEVTGVILAGGLGTRLRSAVADRPKVLADVDGRPFLARLLDQLAAARLRRVVLCTGYLGEQIEACFGSRYRGLELVYSREQQPLGTGGALRLALASIRSPLVMVMNGDSYCDADLSQFATWHFQQRSGASVLLTPVDDTRRYGRVRVGRDNIICSFEEKGEATGPGLINAGVYVLSATLLSDISQNTNVSLERDLFPFWRLHGYTAYAPFLDIGTPESYALAESFFRTFQRAA